MDFQKLFIDSLLSKQMITSSISIKKYLPTSIPISTTGAQTFFYLQAYDDITVSYPYFYEIENLNSYLILYTLSGRGILTFADRKYTLVPGSILFIDCTLRYSINMEQTTSWHFHQAFINGNLIASYYNMFMEEACVLWNLSDFSTIPDIFDQLKIQHSSNTLEKELMNSMLLTDLLTEMILEKKRSKNNQNTVPYYILEIKKQFEFNYQELYSLDILAAKYNRNKYCIAREFTHYMKLSPINYLITCRINAAKNLLWNTDNTITEIGSLVGIENTNHFINLFKKKIGVTPLKFRKQRP